MVIFAVYKTMKPVDLAEISQDWRFIGSPITDKELVYSVQA
jgi:hypothetical protein